MNDTQSKNTQAKKIQGVSKIACRFIDHLSAELGVTIIHQHYNEDTCEYEGTEHKWFDSWNWRRVDGFFVTKDSSNNRRPVAVEFLGDYWHGHPNSRQMVEWKEKMFKKTQGRLRQLRNHEDNYIILYIWESEYQVFCTQFKQDNSIKLASFCRFFDHNLEYTDLNIPGQHTNNANTTQHNE